MTTPATETERSTLRLRGLEVDNLLAFLASVGLLRALEEARPEWDAKLAWHGPPWEARLHLASRADEDAVAAAAAAGIEAIAEQLDVDGRKNVKFSLTDFRAYATRLRENPIGAALAAALATEFPKRNGDEVQVSPFVLMFGQGHQHFLERLVAVARGEVPPRLQKRKSPPDFRAPERIAEALFRPWIRADDSDSFRWDPEEDQRYALRFDDPSRAGAAPTVHGANRLAAIGFLSFPCMPARGRLRAPGCIRGKDVTYAWPVWTAPSSRHAIERLLSHPQFLGLDLAALRPLGVAEIYRARRISNGKFMNVTRARPVSSPRSSENEGSASRR